MDLITGGSSSKLFYRIDLELSKNPGIRLTDLARIAYTNRHYIQRAVHDAVGLTFRDFKKQKRLQRAITLLRRGLLVKQAAEQLHYRSADAFSRFVKAETGITSHSFRCL
jgi:AraC-like DNA-binding protein